MYVSSLQRTYQTSKIIYDNKIIINERDNSDLEEKKESIILKIKIYFLINCWSK